LINGQFVSIGTIRPPRRQKTVPATRWLLKNKWLMRFNATLLLLTVIFLQLGIAANAQKITLDAKNLAMDKVFEQIQLQTGFSFIYRVRDIQQLPALTLDAKQLPLNEVMDAVLSRTDLTYVIKNRTIIIRPKPDAGPAITPVHRKQQRITGVVADQNGDPLGGVTVQVTGTAYNTATDAQGRFTIEASTFPVKLHFSYVGYQQKDLDVEEPGVINVELLSDEKLLEEVVVTSLGFREVKDHLGSTSSSIKAADMTRSGETGLITAMAGKAAGVQINRSSGDPGVGANIQIRGQNTITGSNQPLIIIDGVPVSNSTIGDARGGVAQQSRLNDINPADIESMQILKGASAAGLWGSRAANGVIVITTKQGNNNNKLNVDFSSTLSLDQPNRLHPLQETYGQGINGRYDPTSQYSWGDKIADRTGGEDEVNLNGPRFEAYNGPTYYQIIKKNSRETYNKLREEALFRTGIYSDNFLSLNGGNEKERFYLGLGNLSQKGIYSGQSDYDRTTVRLNASRKFNDVISASARANYIKSSSNRVQKGDNAGGLYIGLLRSSPDFDSRYWKGDYFSSPDAAAVPNRQRSYRNYLGASANPGYNDALWTAHEVTNLTETERFLMSGELVVSPTGWFDITARGGVDTYNDRRVTDNPVNSVTNAGRGNYQESIIKETELNFDIIGKATAEINEDWSGSLIAGFNVNDRRSNELGGVMNDYILADAPPNFTNSAYETNYPFNSLEHRRTARLYATANVAFRDQLFLNVSGAGEAGSTFGSESQSTFYYPSADLAWLFTELPGVRNSWLSFGKLRGSYGIVGIQPDPYRNSTTFVTASFGSWANDLNGAGYGGAFVEDNLQGDPNLRPERKTEWELGTDLRFLDNRLSLSYTYYQNRIEDLLLNVSSAGSTGFSQRYTNAGSMENKGMELELNYNVLSKNDFHWDVYANWSRNINRVLDLAGTDMITFTGGALATVARVGDAMSSLYGGGYLRNDDGSLQLTEYGFPQITTESIILGNPNPDWRGGIGTNVSYKGFSLNFLLETSQGGEYYEGTRGALYGNGTHADVAHEVTLSQDLYNYAGTRVPAGSTVRGNIGDFGAGPVLLDESFYRTLGSHAGQLVEQFVSDGSWTRIREITLGYNFATESFRKWSQLKGISISVTARNPILWTKIKGIDPETNVAGVGNSRGVDYFNNPSTRSLLFSLKISY
jgi:TonB-linked outer membrane protein, SusC/RagA family